MSVQPQTKCKTPAEALDKCVCCHSTRITKFEDEVFCRDCNWNSVNLHAQWAVRFDEAEEARASNEARAQEDALKAKPKKRPPTQHAA